MHKGMIMNDSKKQLVAQINNVEKELYAERERALLCQQELANNKTTYIWGLVLLTTIPLFFLFKSKKTMKGLAHSAVTVGKFALVSFCKKQITEFLEKK